MSLDERLPPKLLVGLLLRTPSEGRVPLRLLLEGRVPLRLLLDGRPSMLPDERLPMPLDERLPRKLPDDD